MLKLRFENTVHIVEEVVMFSVDLHCICSFDFTVLQVNVHLLLIYLLGLVSCFINRLTI